MIFFKRKTKDELTKKLELAQAEARIRTHNLGEKQKLVDIKNQIREQKQIGRTKFSTGGLGEGFKKGSILVAKGVIATGKGLGSVLTEAAKNKAANEKRAKKSKKKKEDLNPYGF